MILGVVTTEYNCPRKDESDQHSMPGSKGSRRSFSNSIGSADTVTHYHGMGLVMHLDSSWFHRLPLHLGEIEAWLGHRANNTLQSWVAEV